MMKRMIRLISRGAHFPMKAKRAGPKKQALAPIRDSKTTPIRGNKRARLVHGIQGSGSQKNRTQITNRPHQMDQADFRKSDKF